MQQTLLHLDKEDVRLLQPKVQLARAKAGQVLVKEGTPPLGLFIVRQGSVAVRRLVNKFPVTVATLEVGEMFGESAFINPAPSPATASVFAAEDSDLIILTPQRLQPLFDEHPALFGRFCHSIALTLSRRLRAFNEQLGGQQRDRFGALPNWEII